MLVCSGCIFKKIVVDKKPYKACLWLVFCRGGSQAVRQQAATLRFGSSILPLRFTIFLKLVRACSGMGKPVILANRSSGRGRDRLRLSLLRRFARKCKAKLRWLSPRSLFRKIRGADVIVAGGDGSFEIALNEPGLRNKRLGFFPLGSGNALFPFFYKGRWIGELRNDIKLKESVVDVLELKWDGGSRETLFLSVGFDADVMRLTEKKRHGLMQYVKGFWRTVVQKQERASVRCSIDGDEFQWVDCVNVSLGKVPYYGYGLRSIPGRVHADDGFVYGFVCHAAHRVLRVPLRLLAAFLALFHIDWPFKRFKAKEFSLRSDVPLPVQAGGDFLGYSKSVVVRIKRQQRVLTGGK